MKKPTARSGFSKLGSAGRGEQRELPASDCKQQMLMNWPERVWIFSPVRALVLRLQARKWLRLAGEKATGTALEIGCGHGRGARILAERMGFNKVHAFDLEEALIRKAVKRLPKRLHNRIHFFVGDAQDLPFGDCSFDAVVNYGIIHHVLDWRRCVREISRVLRSGGIFYFEEIYPPLYSNFLLARMLRHPKEDRFEGQQFLEALEAADLNLLPGAKTTSKFGIVAAASRR